MEGYKWMQCTQCKETVLVNATGICLSCHGSFEKSDAPDKWVNIMRKETINDHQSRN